MFWMVLIVASLVGLVKYNNPDTKYNNFPKIKRVHFCSFVWFFSENYEAMRPVSSKKKHKTCAIW